MIILRDLLNAFPHSTNQAFSWLAFCLTLDTRFIDWPSIVFVVLPLGIIVLDADIARWQDQGLGPTPPRVPERISQRLMVHLIIIFWTGTFENVQISSAQPNLSRALLVAFDLYITTILKWVPLMILFCPGYWTMCWVLKRSWRWQH